MAPIIIPSKKIFTIIGVLHFLCLVNLGHSQTSPTWEHFDDDTSPPVKRSFSFDPNRLYIHGIYVDDKHFDTFAKLPVGIPKDAKQLFMAILFHSGEDRKDARFVSDMARMSLLLYSTGSDFSKLKIVSRSRSIKLGYAGEGPKGFKYFTAFVIYGCSKIPGQVTRNSVFSYVPNAPQNSGFFYEGAPMGHDEFLTFLDRCRMDLWSVGDPQRENDHDVMKYSAQDILNKIHHNERVVFPQ